MAKDDINVIMYKILRQKKFGSLMKKVPKALTGVDFDESEIDRKI